MLCLCRARSGGLQHRLVHVTLQDAVLDSYASLSPPPLLTPNKVSEATLEGLLSLLRIKIFVYGLLVLGPVLDKRVNAFSDP